MKIYLILLLFCVINVNSNKVAIKTISFVKNIVESDLAKICVEKLGEKFKKLGVFAKKVSPILGPAGDLVNFVLFFTTQEDNYSENFKNITQDLNKIKEKLEVMSEQISSIDNKMKTSTMEIKTEVRFQAFFQGITGISKGITDFELIIDSYATNHSAVIFHLNNFIDEYKKNNLEFIVVDYLDLGIEVSTSLIDKIISLYRQYQTGYENEISSSLAKTLNEIYLTVLLKITRGFMILDVATNTKIALTGIFHPEDKEFLNNRKKKIYEMLRNSLEKTFAKLTDQDYESLINLKVNGNDNKVRLVNVLQRFWEQESVLSGSEDTCKKDCSFYQNQMFNGNGCYGVVRDCKYVSWSSYFIRQNPQIDRIYEGYTMNNVWQGKNEAQRDTAEYLGTWTRGFTYCELCHCVCDNKYSSKTIRQFYTGTIEAEDEYVITGARFVEQNRIIFLQIQVGKLLGMGLVDQKTVKWQKLPTNDTPTFQFDYYNRRMELSALKVQNGVLTGISFKEEGGYSSKTLILTVFGRSFVDYTRGILGAKIHTSRPYVSHRRHFESKISGLAESGQFSILKSGLIEFGMSNETKDASQSFLPYFDGSPITFNTPSPLAGIELYHYTNNEKYGGFIRPNLISLNYQAILN